MSSKSTLIILTYTVSKLRHSVVLGYNLLFWKAVYPCNVMEVWPQHWRLRENSWLRPCCPIWNFWSWCYSMRFGPVFSSIVFSTPTTWSHVFQSCVFRSRVFNRRVEFLSNKIVCFAKYRITHQIFRKKEHAYLDVIFSERTTEIILF